MLYGGFDNFEEKPDRVNPAVSAGIEQQVIYSVSEITEEIKNCLGRAFQNICVRGEVSGVKNTIKGHTYFDLKDGKSVINCVLFKWSAPNFKQDVKDGMQMRVYGAVSMYNSRCQIYVNNLEEEGLGQLQIAFEKLKQKLQAEGLFSQARKRPLPSFPKQIGIVTSQTGAAIRDIFSVLRRRGGNLHIILSPAAVQGKGSAEEIVASIKALNDNFPNMDVMLVGRGGGSLEDLWPFNEEIVARAIAASRIPVISCVGHEIDTTIADFVADKRAETPSAAAEMVVKSREYILQRVDGLERRLLQGLRVYYENISGRFNKLAENRLLTNPLLLLEKPAQKLDDLTEHMLSAEENKILAISARIELLTGKLNALSPLFPLKKGYAIVKNSHGGTVRTSSHLSAGEHISLRFYKGSAEAQVLSLSNENSLEHSGTEIKNEKNMFKIKSKNNKQNPEQEMLW